MRSAVAKEFDPDRSLAVEYDARHKRAGEHGQTLTVHIGIGISTKDRQATAITNAEIGDGRAALTLHHFAVLVIESGNSEGPGGLQNGRGDWIGIARHLVARISWAERLGLGSVEDHSPFGDRDFAGRWSRLLPSEASTVGKSG